MRPARRSGFLLVEAMMAAVAIGVGLVAISQGIGASLQALTRLEERQRAWQLAESIARQLEAEARYAPVPAQRSEPCAPPDSAYAWTYVATPVTGAAAASFVEPVVFVTIVVHRADDEHGQVRLTTLWPASWVNL